MAQEIDATVSVNKERISRTGIDHVNNLAKQIQDYINTFKWTDDLYQEQERLNCTIQINLNEVTDNLSFTASIVVQLNRPIFGTLQKRGAKNHRANRTAHVRLCVKPKGGRQR